MKNVARMEHLVGLQSLPRFLSQGRIVGIVATIRSAERIGGTFVEHQNLRTPFLGAPILSRTALEGL